MIYDPRASSHDRARLVLDDGVGQGGYLSPADYESLDQKGDTLCQLIAQAGGRGCRVDSEESECRLLQPMASSTHIQYRH